jgi:hypothetical protein
MEPSFRSVGAPPGRKLLPPRREANGWPTGAVRMCGGVRIQGSIRPPPPPSNRYGPYGILVVCRHNLWPTVRMELGQDGWLKQPAAKIFARTTSKEDLSWPVIRDYIGGHQCSGTLLTGDPSSRNVGAPLGCELLPPPPPPRWEQTVDPLDQ